VNSKKVKISPISEIRGPGLWAQMADHYVTVRGVVTGVARRGFFIQNTRSSEAPGVSDAMFVFSPEWRADEGMLLEASGKVLDYVRGEKGKPVTQLKLADVRLVKRRGPKLKPVELTARKLPADNAGLAKFLNGLEGMLVSIAPGQTFISPSNPYGDYVLLLNEGDSAGQETRTGQGGVLVDHGNPLRWYPGFRMTNYSDAPRLNVGSKLLSRITGPLNYRVESFQIMINHRIDVEPAPVTLYASALKPEPGSLTIMTMNGFNLDTHIESAALVKNPQLDIDDDWGDGRFDSLAQAVVLQGNSPDIVALQEIQDNDGAEMTEVTDASVTYKGLIDTIRQHSGIEYHWVDIAPAVGADGGQPGGSIRNGYLYDPARVELLADKTRSIGLEEPAFEGSRKPLVAHFRERASGRELVCINVHLASKRHQLSIFAPEKPGHDARQPIRVRQAELIRAELASIRKQGLDYYVTGDFNDTEESETLAALTGEESINLVKLLEPEQRFDYNHRGKLQVLMHGIVPRELAAERSEYDIIHGNELLGVQPGRKGDKPSDHAYVMAKIRLA
jgi:predicted extracellular nuclease